MQFREDCHLPDVGLWHLADNRYAELLVAFGRLCCKSRKLQGLEFFAKNMNRKQLPICIASIALPKSPVNLT